MADDQSLEGYDILAHVGDFLTESEQDRAENEARLWRLIEGMSVNEAVPTLLWLRAQIADQQAFVEEWQTAIAPTLAAYLSRWYQRP
jgi:hypothetical protein